MDDLTPAAQRNAAIGRQQHADGQTVAFDPLAEPITDAYLAELERLAGAATDAEKWTASINEGKFYISAIGPLHSVDIGRIEAMRQSLRDSEYAKAAMAAVPALVAEVRRLRGCIDGMLNEGCSDDMRAVAAKHGFE